VAGTKVPRAVDGEGVIMSADTIERVMRDYVEALSSRGDFGRYFTDDATFTTMETGEMVRGREACTASIAYMHHQVFDGRVVVRHIVASDGVAVLEANLDGTHVGAMGDVQPTGRHVNVPYCVVYDFDGERIRAARGYMSFSDLMRQLVGEEQAAASASRG
jgi:predicted ester cyclase